MPKLEIFTDKAFFKINGTPYQRGNFNVTVIGDRVGIDYPNGRPVTLQTEFNNYTDLNDNPYASLAALLTDIEEGLFFLAGSELPPELVDYFENQLTSYTLYETVTTGTTSGSISTQTGIQIIRDTFNGADLDVSALGADGYPNNETLLDSNSDIVTANFNPVDTPPDWQLDNPDTDGNNYALIFRVSGTRQDLTEYIDNNPAYRQIDDRAGGGGQVVELNTFLAVSSQAQSPDYTNALGYANVTFDQFDASNTDFELQPDNITIVQKRLIKVGFSAHLEMLRVSISARSNPFIRILVSVDGGSNFTPISFSTANGYIRNLNNGFGSAAISVFTQTYPAGSQFRVQVRTLAENNNIIDQHEHVYFNLVSYLTSTTPIINAPIIGNPLPSTQEIIQNQLFTYDLEISGATSVILQNAPTNATITTAGILEINTSDLGNFPNFKVVASNTGGTVESESNLTVVAPFNQFAVTFDGVNEYMVGNDNAGFTQPLPQINQSYAWSFWIKPLPSGVPTSGQVPILKQRNPSTNQGFYINLTPSLDLNIRFQEGAGVYVEKRTNNALTLNNWHHVVIVKDATSYQANAITFYVNGVLASVTTRRDDTVTNITNPEPLEIGINGAAFANMILDEVFYWENILVTQATVEDIYQLGTPEAGIPKDYNNYLQAPTGGWRMGENLFTFILPNVDGNPNRELLFINGGAANLTPPNYP